MKVMKTVLKEELCAMVKVGEVHLGFMKETGTIDAVFVLGWLLLECHAKEKSCICAL